jgi:peptidoglycan/LPS O-acetylase OafA/YrhL
MASLAFILGFTIQANKWGLERNGLSMTIVAVGACMLIVVAAQTKWTAPAVFRPLLRTGEHSYEIYLTHVFVVFAFFDLFLEFGKPLWAVPLLFIGTLPTAVALGALVARAFSEPMNRWLRKRWGQNSGIGSVLAASGEQLEALPLRS